VEYDCELPAIRQEDGDAIARSNSGCGQSTRGTLDQLAVFCVADAAHRRARGIDDGCFLTVSAARVEHYIVHELAFRVGE